MTTTAHNRPPRRLLATLLAVSAAVIAPGLAYRDVIAHQGPPPPAGMPACAFGNRLAPALGYEEWADTLLDTEHRLPANYAPPDLVDISWGDRSIRLRALAVDDLRAMLAAARAEGRRLVLNSGYRSHRQQSAVYARAVAEQGEAAARRGVARPGHSEHQLGTAVDLAGDHRWLADNAWRFGFVMSYPPGRSPHASCYMPEPWHYRYFGREKAALIQDSGLSPREYLWVEMQPRVASAGALQAGRHAADGQVDEAQQLPSLGVIVGQRAQSAEQQDLHLR
jgi:zinc D-Ala-D-Ala carboxypeptidase